MVGGFDFWGEGPLVGATFPAGAAHGWWEGGKVLAALSLLRRALFPPLVVYNLFNPGFGQTDFGFSSKLCTFLGAAQRKKMKLGGVK